MAFKRMFQTVDTHGGVPMRVVTGGVPGVRGQTVFEKMKWLEENDDQLRKLLLREPRGYPPQCLNLIVPAADPSAAAGYIIMEQSEYCLMSGWNTIAVATALLETGMLEITGPETKFKLEAPGGLIEVTAHCEGRRVKAVTFKNMPCFVGHLGVELDIPQVGKAIVDTVWAGAWFVIADVANFGGLAITPSCGQELTRIAALMCRAAEDKLSLNHPQFGHVPITLAMICAGDQERNIPFQSCVTMLTAEVDYSDPTTWGGAIDRSPCGTGTCARMTSLLAHGRLTLGENFSHQSIIGLEGKGRLIEQTKIGEYPAVIPEVTGNAWITGFNNFVLDETDPFPEGFKVGDIW
ncbi:hypothetical protein C4J81_06560 [Deltaproteobacteria bacterium Smac51]|nr:hypothetical protein C4J81_06560 [Deltaproteobacteria bacterium Smac51]